MEVPVIMYGYKLEILKDNLLLDGKPFYLASGDMHYFRIFKGGWRKRLELMKDFGLSAVQTYVPWNLHEPEEGVFDFSGRLDLAAFLKLADETGLKVMLRPAPFICSEWDFGGLPYWLLKSRDAEVRCMDKAYIKALDDYYRRLCKEFIPFLSTRGGPVIAVAVENEYGGYGNDKAYLKHIKDFLSENGVDVPFYTTDGRYALKYGTLPGVWEGINYRLESKVAIDHLRAFQPDMPAFVGEYWSGRAQHWDETFFHRDVEPVAEAYKVALNEGAYVNFYMFAGGTNFGFMNGANHGFAFTRKPDSYEKYIPMTTSYDTDALISENGVPTEKYYACRAVLDAYLGKPVRETPPGVLKRSEMCGYEAQEIKNVAVTEYAPLFDNLEELARTAAPVESVTLKTMEELSQDYGFILYSTFLDGPSIGVPQKLSIFGLHDRATVYLDGVYIGRYMRDRKDEKQISLIVPDKGARLDILVENCGRINGGMLLKDRKGITECVKLGIVMLYNWTIRPIPMRDMSVLEFKDISVLRRQAEVNPAESLILKLPGGQPAFYRGKFEAKAGIDTFLRMDGWKKGVAWVNGFNLGRYWETGPQETLYVPGGLLKEGVNEIVVFEIHSPAPGFTVDFVMKHTLDGVLKLETT